MIENVGTNATWNSLYVEMYQSDGRRNFDAYFFRAMETYFGLIR